MVDCFPGTTLALQSAVVIVSRVLSAFIHLSQAADFGCKGSESTRVWKIELIGPIWIP